MATTVQVDRQAVQGVNITAYRLRRIIGRVLNYALLIVMAIFFLFPIVFMVVSSLKSENTMANDVRSVVNAFVPTEVRFDNYNAVFTEVPFFQFLFNSIFVTAITVGLGLVINSMIAYALARLRWRGKEWVLGLIVALIIVPLEAISVPLLMVVNALPWIDGQIGWLDSYHVQIIPFIAHAFSIFLFYQFFISIPKELDEAAAIDGATSFMIYYRVILPLSRPVIATVAILQSLSIWGSYLWPLMTTRGEAVRPLTVGITSFYVENIQWTVVMAFASLIVLPVLILFIFFQRWFIQSVVSSGVKG